MSAAWHFSVAACADQGGTHSPVEETESSHGMPQFTGHEGSLFHKSLCLQAKHRASSDLGELKRIKAGGHGIIRDRECGLELSRDRHRVWGGLISRTG